MKKESKVRFEQNNEQIVQKVETKQKQNFEREVKLQTRKTIKRIYK